MPFPLNGLPTALMPVWINVVPLWSTVRNTSVTSNSNFPGSIALRYQTCSIVQAVRCMNLTPIPVDDRLLVAMIARQPQ